MICSIFALLLLATFVHAQEVPQPGPRVRFDQANAVVRYDCTSVWVNADGSGETLRRYRVALLSDRAVREYAQDQTVYNLGYDTVIVVAARVHLSDGRTIDVDSSAIKDVPLPAFGKFFIQNVREKIITFPALAQGAEIEVQLREITHEPPMDGQFNLSEYFEHTDPVLLKRVDVSLPENLPLKWKVRGNGVGHDSTVADGRIQHVWTIENTPQMVPEPGMPPFAEVARQLLATTIPDWDTWSRWYHELAEPEMVADSAICAEVASLTKGKSRQEAIREIFQFVSNEIRYVDTAYSGRKAGYKPESAAVTYRNKYGVCRDKAALMVTMLREAGVKSDITLMNPSWKIDGDLAVDQFNHAIVTVWDGGKPIYIDPTVEKTTEYLAANEQDRAVLTCTPAGDELAWTPVEDPENNLYAVDVASMVNESGRMESAITISTRGFPDLVLRSTLQASSPEEREILFQNIVQRMSPRARLDELIISDLADLDTPLAIKLKVSADEYVIKAGEYWLLNTIAQGRNLDILSSWFLSGSELTERLYPLRLESTFALRMTETLEYPSGFKVRSLPDDVRINEDEFRMTCTSQSKGQRVTVVQALELSALDIPLSRYPDLLQLVNRLESLERGKVVLTAKS